MRIKKGKSGLGGSYLALYLLGDLAVLEQEILGALAPLSQASLTEGEEGAAFLDQPQLDSQVEKVTLFADATIEHDVKLGGPERRGYFVLDHLGSDAASRYFRSLLK